MDSRSSTSPAVLAGSADGSFFAERYTTVLLLKVPMATTERRWRTSRATVPRLIMLQPPLESNGSPVLEYS